MLFKMGYYGIVFLAFSWGAQVMGSPGERGAASQLAFLEMKLAQNKLIENLRNAAYNFEKSGATHFNIAQADPNCGQKGAFSIAIKKDTPTGSRVFTGTLISGGMTRVLTIELNQRRQLPITVSYQISPMSVAHVIPMIPDLSQVMAQNPLVEPAVGFQRILKDFDTYIRQRKPQDLPDPITVDTHGGYLYWLLAMAELQDYLIHAIEFQKTFSPQAQQ